MFKKLYNLFSQTKCYYSSINFYDTIYALSSGYGKCGVAVIRVSGKHSSSALLRLGKFKSLPAPRLALLRRLWNPQTDRILDRGVVIWFPGIHRLLPRPCYTNHYTRVYKSGPNSFTGEDSCEFQVHGGVAVIDAILSALKTVPGLRPAERGEFTKRAFYNGKIDLTEVEGLDDLLQAETEIQRQQALLQTEGVYSTMYRNWRDVILLSMATFEALLNFDETDALNENLLDRVVADITKLNEAVSAFLKNKQSGQRLRNGVYTAIVGEPNVGKSSFLNLICKRPAAIVTSIAGTTRDILESVLDIGGYPVVLADTAGLRSDTSDVIEIEGIKRTREYVKNCDLVVLLIDSTKLVGWMKNNTGTFFDYVNNYIETLNLKDLFPGSSENNGVNVESLADNESLIFSINKIDLLNKEDTELVNVIHSSVTSMSCVGDGDLSNVMEVMTRKLKVLCGTPSSENPLVSHSRHQRHLEECSDYLDRFISCASYPSADLALAGHYLRLALNSLEKIIGRVANNQLLDIIFNNFCIGK